MSVVANALEQLGGGPVSTEFCVETGSIATASATTHFRASRDFLPDL
jgi:hypothetical protein